MSAICTRVPSTRARARQVRSARARHGAANRQATEPPTSVGSFANDRARNYAGKSGPPPQYGIPAGRDRLEEREGGARRARFFRGSDRRSSRQLRTGTIGVAQRPPPTACVRIRGTAMKRGKGCAHARNLTCYISRQGRLAGRCPALVTLHTSPNRIEIAS